MRHVILLITLVPLGGCIYYNYSQPYPDYPYYYSPPPPPPVTITTSRTLLRRASEEVALSISTHRKLHRLRPIC
jgi:hypothetical protein